MSDFTPPGQTPASPPPTPPAPGWWQASDGNWYPPETAQGGPGAPPPAPGFGPPPAPGFGPPPAPGYGPPPAPGFRPPPAPGYGQPPGYANYAQPQQTNGLAVASLVLGIIWLFWLGSILAVIFGFIAIGQINGSGGRQGGKGLAIAGLVLGFVGVGTLLLSIIGNASS
jgi:hypothetical protein